MGVGGKCHLKDVTKLKAVAGIDDPPPSYPLSKDPECDRGASRRRS